MLKLIHVAIRVGFEVFFLERAEDSAGRLGVLTQRRAWRTEVSLPFQGEVPMRSRLRSTSHHSASG